MKLTVPEGLGLLGAGILGLLVVLGSQAAQHKPVDEWDRTYDKVPTAVIEDIRKPLAKDAIPVTERLTRSKTKARARPVIGIQPSDPREISVFRRDEGRLQIVQLPTARDGVVTYHCKGGIEIVGHTRKFGTIRMQADQAVIKRVSPRRNEDEPAVGPHDETWFEEADMPMEVHLKGNVILRIAGRGEHQTVRATDVEYDFVTDRVLAFDGELEVDAPGLGTPIKIVSPRIEQFHPGVRQPDGSLVRSERREIRAGHEVPTTAKSRNVPPPPTTNHDQAGPKP